MASDKRNRQPSFRTRLMNFELKASCGGRGIRWAIVQMLSISTQVWQISPSRKSVYTQIPVLLSRNDVNTPAVCEPARMKI